jgi:hypothetical protein
MKREPYALAAGFGTNVAGYVAAIFVLNLLGRGEAPSLMWGLGPLLWLASIILGGWVASVIAGSRQFLLGYLSAFLGMLVVALLARFGLHISIPALATAAGLLVVSALGALGALIYSRK